MPEYYVISSDAKKKKKVVYTKFTLNLMCYIYIWQIWQPYAGEHSRNDFSGARLLTILSPAGS